MAATRKSTNRVARLVLAVCGAAVLTASIALAVRRNDTQQLPFLASADKNSVVVRSVDDASVIRELASGGDARHVRRIVLSPDRQLVYFERRRPRRCPINFAEGDNEQEWVTTDYSEIVRVRTTGGPIEHVAWGQDLVMAANGDLFYLSSEETARDVIGYPCSADLVEFIRRLRGPRSKGPGRSVYSHNGPAPTYYPFTASPNGRLLIGNGTGECRPLCSDGDGPEQQMLYGLAGPSDPPPEANEEDFEGGGDARRIWAVEFPKHAADNSRVIGFIGESTVAGTVSSGGENHVATFDPVDGGSMEVLFEVERDSQIVPDWDGKNYLVLNQRNGRQEARRWSRDEGFVRIGTIPAGPVTWTGPAESYVAPKDGTRIAGDIAEDAATAVPSIVRTITPETSCAPSPTVTSTPKLRPAVPTLSSRVGEVDQDCVAGAVPEANEDLIP